MDIEAYLDGSLSAPEKAAFEKRLLADPVLRQELEQYQSLKTDLDWHFAAKDVAAAEVLRGQLEAKRRRWSRLLLGTLLVLLAGFVAFWWLPKEPQPLQPATETPSLPQNTAPKMEVPSQSMPTPPTQKIQAPSQPIAGDIKPRSGDLMRNLPAEEISETTLAFFKQQWEGFVPAVPEVGVWAKPLRQIRNNQAADAHLLLKKVPSGDTSAYLLAVTELMLKRPSAAQDMLYPLMSDKKWQIEAQYLLVWAYLLGGNEELAKGALKMMPEGFRDTKEMSVYMTD